MSFILAQNPGRFVNSCNCDESRSALNVKHQAACCREYRIQKKSKEQSQWQPWNINENLAQNQGRYTHTCKGVESCFEFKTAAREFQEYTIKEYGTSQRTAADWQWRLNLKNVAWVWNEIARPKKRNQKHLIYSTTYQSQRKACFKLRMSSKEVAGIEAKTSWYIRQHAWARRRLVSNYYKFVDVKGVIKRKQN